ncbi:unnamed protein product [Prorocentrum cordatum]|uniref:RING-type domain-containing protein n=1 Tax=Prorocentrum cordatum TaxID=2364126 RepID=A0ABN9WAV5_9DINO|nr:unnamed protein product [Polarella glacialis]
MAAGTPPRGGAASVGTRSASCERWRSTVARAQAEASLDLGSIQRAQQRELCFRKCKAAKGLALRTRALVAETLLQMSQATVGKDHQAARDRCAKAAAASRERHDRHHELLERVQQGARRILSAGHAMERSRSPSPRSLDSEALLRGVTSSDESALQETRALVGASGAGLDSDRSPTQSSSSACEGGRAGRAGTSSGPSRVDTLLQALRSEPAEDLERAAKFGLYEAYLAEVESIREILIKFHSESCPLLDQQVATWMDGQLREVDSRQKMGTFETGDWFVYHMMRQAHANNCNMTSKLDLWEEKIRNLCAGDPQPCPICLEHYSCDRPSQTLGCCHKACNRCWGNWTKLMHGMGKAAFCPSCHRKEFLSSLSAPAEVAAVRARSPRSPPPPSTKISL